MPRVNVKMQNNNNNKNNKNNKLYDNKITGVNLDT